MIIIKYLSNLNLFYHHNILKYTNNQLEFYLTLNKRYMYLKKCNFHREISMECNFTKFYHQNNYPDMYTLYLV